jgi:hypothetical protein
LEKRQRTEVATIRKVALLEIAGALLHLLAASLAAAGIWPY